MKKILKQGNWQYSHKIKKVISTKDIKWNFTKFLVDRNGNVIRRYEPATKPEDIEKDILNLLQE
jgi:glutathione peroxidase